MTLRSKLGKMKSSPGLSLALSVSLLVCTFLCMPVQSQNSHRVDSESLIAADPSNPDGNGARLPPPPQLRKRGPGDDSNPQFQGAPVDSEGGGGPRSFEGQENSQNERMRRRAIRQRMMQKFGAEGQEGNAGPGMGGRGMGDGPGAGQGFGPGNGEAGANQDFPGRRMRGGAGGGNPDFKMNRLGESGINNGPSPMDFSGIGEGRGFGAGKGMRGEGSGGGFGADGAGRGFASEGGGRGFGGGRTGMGR